MKLGRLWLMVLVLGLSSLAQAQIQFTDVAAELGVGNDGQSLSVSFSDYDGDGKPDVLVGNATGSNKLWRNDGNSFVDVTESSGIFNDLIGTRTWSGSSVIQGDYDNDGDIDLFIAVDAFPPDPEFEPTRSYLYANNGDGTFTDVTEQAGVPALDTGSYGAAFTDYDHDGQLDLYIVHLGGSNLLYHNNGDGTFTDVAVDLGVEGGEADLSLGLAAIFFDGDGDGDLDLYAANQFGPPSFYYANNGDGTFEDRSATSGIDFPGDPTGVAVGDYDNDADLDLFVANWFVPGTLFRNEGDGTFVEVGAEAGVNIEDDCRGTLFFDYDNDGFLDLLIAKKGFPHLFQNRGNGEFLDVSQEVGLTQEMGGNAAAVADYDMDGDLDLYLANTGFGGPDGEPDVLYRNDGGNENNWLQIRVQSLDHIDGIGSKVQISVAGETRVTQIFGGYGVTQDSNQIHFGLGDHAVVDRIEVTFSGGTAVALEQPVQANQILIVSEAGFKAFVPASVTPHQKQPALLGDIKRFVLLQNYPNPFNPETWFPYHLGEDTAVTLRLFNSQGQLVRELDLGVQKAGAYLDRSSAAYWDGKDGSGQVVSSGTYFYQLLAGPFTATRKMVILR